MTLNVPFAYRKELGGSLAELIPTTTFPLLIPTSDVLALRVCASRFVRQLVSLPGRSSGETQENAEERVELE